MTQSIEDEKKEWYHSPRLTKGSFQFPTPWFSRHDEKKATSDGNFFLPKLLNHKWGIRAG
jgi:hypothetical protein